MSSFSCCKDIFTLKAIVRGLFSTAIGGSAWYDVKDSIFDKTITDIRLKDDLWESVHFSVPNSVHGVSSLRSVF